MTRLIKSISLPAEIFAKLDKNVFDNEEGFSSYVQKLIIEDLKGREGAEGKKERLVTINKKIAELTVERETIEKEIGEIETKHHEEKKKEIDREDIIKSNKKHFRRTSRFIKQKPERERDNEWWKFRTQNFNAATGLNLSVDEYRKRYHELMKKG